MKEPLEVTPEKTTVNEEDVDNLPVPVKPPIGRPPPPKPDRKDTTAEPLEGRNLKLSYIFDQKIFSLLL